ncbi:MAG: hypothetical protein ACT4OY_08655 [Alphaproteobacteria bacterium]
MALTDIELCARALVKIGAAPIDSFTDGTAESEIAASLFAPARDALLSAYPWSFATAQAELEAEEDPPVADYDYAFALPEDFLRALSAGTGGKGRGLNFRMAGGMLHANADSVILTYIYRPEESSFPPYFDQVLINRLAAEFTIPVTENTGRAEAFYKLADLEFQRARQIDAQQDTPSKIEDFSLINARNL